MPTRHRRLLIPYRANTSFFKLSKMGLSALIRWSVCPTTSLVSSVNMYLLFMLLPCRVSLDRASKRERPIPAQLSSRASARVMSVLFRHRGRKGQHCLLCSASGRGFLMLFPVLILLEGTNKHLETRGLAEAREGEKLVAGVEDPRCGAAGADKAGFLH